MQTSTGFTGTSGGVETFGEDFGASRSLGSMLVRLTIAAVVVFALAGALADLLRGRRPLLLA